MYIDEFTKEEWGEARFNWGVIFGIYLGAMATFIIWGIWTLISV